MTQYFKALVIALLTAIALINGIYAYGMYLHAHTPCLADGQLVFDASRVAPPEWIAKAQEDIGLLMAGKPPRHVKQLACAADGGSCVYQTDRYSLTIWYSLARVDNIAGHVRGYTVAPRDGGASLGHTWFSPDAKRADGRS